MVSGPLGQYSSSTMAFNPEKLRMLDEETRRRVEGALGATLLPGTPEPMEQGTSGGLSRNPTVTVGGLSRNPTVTVGGLSRHG